jgi:hypothetical protein
MKKGTFLGGTSVITVTVGSFGEAGRCIREGTGKISRKPSKTNPSLKKERGVTGPEKSGFTGGESFMVGG